MQSMLRIPKRKGKKTTKELKKCEEGKESNKCKERREPNDCREGKGCK